MASMTPYGIALGSNLGDRRANLERGVEMLLERMPEAKLVAGASLYETDPIDCAPDTQAFLNTVIEIESPLPPHDVHAHLVAVEQGMGRPLEREKNAPRTLDLDVLYAGGFVSDDPVLILPHPRLHVRRFVLKPLAEIRPGLKLPNQMFNIEELLASLPDDPASVRLSGAWKYRCG